MACAQFMHPREKTVTNNVPCCLLEPRWQDDCSWTWWRFAKPRGKKIGWLLGGLSGVDNGKNHDGNRNFPKEIDSSDDEECSDRPNGKSWAQKKKRKRGKEEKEKKKTRGPNENKMNSFVWSTMGAMQRT